MNQSIIIYFEFGNDWIGYVLIVSSWTHEDIWRKHLLEMNCTPTITNCTGLFGADCLRMLDTVIHFRIQIRIRMNSLGDETETLTCCWELTIMQTNGSMIDELHQDIFLWITVLGFAKQRNHIDLGRFSPATTISVSVELMVFSFSLVHELWYMAHLPSVANKNRRLTMMMTHLLYSKRVLRTQQQQQQQQHPRLPMGTFRQWKRSSNCSSELTRAATSTMTNTPNTAVVAHKAARTPTPTTTTALSTTTYKNYTTTAPIELIYDTTHKENRTPRSKKSTMTEKSTTSVTAPPAARISTPNTQQTTTNKKHHDHHNKNIPKTTQLNPSPIPFHGYRGDSIITSYKMHTTRRNRNKKRR